MNSSFCFVSMLNCIKVLLFLLYTVFESNHKVFSFLCLTYCMESIQFHSNSRWQNFIVFFIVEWYSTVYMFYTFFMLLFGYGHLIVFSFGLLWINIKAYIFLWVSVSIMFQVNSQKWFYKLLIWPFWVVYFEQISFPNQ